MTYVHADIVTKDLSHVHILQNNGAYPDNYSPKVAIVRVSRLDNDGTHADNYSPKAPMVRVSWLEKHDAHADSYSPTVSISPCL